MHRYPGGHACVDRASRTELGDRADHVTCVPRFRGKAWALLAEQQYAALGQIGGFDRDCTGQDVDSNDGEPLVDGPFDESHHRGVVHHVQIPIRDHGAAAVPPAFADYVDAGSEKGVRVANDRSDVEIVLPVLDGYVERVPPQIKVGDDRFSRPVAVPIDHIAAIALRQEVGIQARIVGPWLRIRPNPDLPRRVIFGHTSRLGEARPPNTT